VKRTKIGIALLGFAVLGGAACELLSPTQNRTKQTPSPIAGERTYYRDSLTTLSPEMYEDEEVSEGKRGGPGIAGYSSAQWHAMPQGTRNQALLEEAYREYQSYNGRATPWNCKTWIQHLVPIGSGGVEWVPQTSMPNQCPRADGYTWCGGSHAVAILQNFCPSNFTYYFRPGMIVQTWYGGDYNPHTAMVYAVSATNLTVIDCNFVGRNVIGIHGWSLADFSSKVRAFTLYEIR